jgi:uncharacterized tellurite resistance protein B-like protein
MFGSLKTFVSSLAEDATRENRFESKESQLATAALLIRVAAVECEMSKAKQAKLHAVLQSCFRLDEPATIRLINAAAAADRNAIDLYHFTRLLNDALDDEGRRRIVQMMWEVVYADGNVSASESNIVWRSADLLGVSSRQRIELRQRIAAGRVTPAPV